MDSAIANGLFRGPGRYIFWKPLPAEGKDISLPLGLFGKEEQ